MSSQFNQFGGLFSQNSFLQGETDNDALSDLSNEEFDFRSSFGSGNLNQSDFSSFKTDPDLDNILASDFRAVSRIVQPSRSQSQFMEFEQSAFDENANGQRFPPYQPLYQRQHQQQPPRMPSMENVFQSRMPQQFQALQVPELQVRNSQQPLQSYATAKQGGNALLAQQQLQQRLAQNLPKQSPRAPFQAQTMPQSIVRPRMPAIPNKASIIYQVQFKLDFRYFLCHPHFVADADIHLNSFVVVEGEKGEDLGVVVDTLTTAQFTDLKNKERGLPQYCEEDRVLRFILRVANSWLDCSMLPEKFHDEKIVVEHANEVVRHILNLPMQVVAAEYQFDRTKLYIYYTANTRVDFRELISKLYAIFKTCIWLKKLHPNQTFEARRSAVVALRTGSFAPPTPTCM